MWKIIKCFGAKCGNKCFGADEKSVANNFNELFTSVGSNKVKKIQSLAKENNYHPSKFVPDSYPESEQFSFEPVESSLVGYVVRSMPDNKAPGIEYILTLKIPASQKIWISLNRMPLNANSNVVKHVIR